MIVNMNPVFEPENIILKPHKSTVGGLVRSFTGHWPGGPNGRAGPKCAGALDTLEQTVFVKYDKSFNVEKNYNLLSREMEMVLSSLNFGR